MRGRGKATCLISKVPFVMPLYNQIKRLQNKRISCKVGDQKYMWGAKKVAAKRELMISIETALIITPNA